MEIKFKSGQVIDFAAAFPMTLGDWRKFEAAGILNDKGEVAATGANATADFIDILASKVLGKDVAEGDLDALTMRQLNDLVEYLQKRSLESQEPDPTTGSSPDSLTASAPSTVGESVKSLRSQ